MADDERASELSAEATEASPEATNPPEKIPFFGARRRARELSTELTELRRRTDELGLLSLVELEARRNVLTHEIEQQTSRLRAERDAARTALRREADEASAT